MGHIFISHVEENSDIALRIAEGLEGAGYTAWCYERDAIPGPSYLLQTARQIEAAAAVVLLISPDSLGSHQVTAEVVRAHESARPFVPVLIGISHVEFGTRQPEWREALGSSTSITLPASGVDAILPRILDGLRGLGIAPSSDGDGKAAGARPSHVYTSPAPPPSPGPAAATRTTRRRTMIGVAAAVVIAMPAVVGIAMAIGGGGGSGSGGGRRETATTVELAGGSLPGASNVKVDEEQFAPADTTPLATSAGSMRVARATLTQKSCPPAGIPGGCLTADGSDRYLLLHLAPASGGSAALTQVFLNEAQQSSLSFGGGLQAGNYRVSLDESQNPSQIEIVYGIVSASANTGKILLHWPGNQALQLTVT